MSSTDHTDDDVVLVDREHRTSNAGPALPGEAVLVRVTPVGTLDAEAVAGWLSSVVARARAP